MVVEAEIIVGLKLEVGFDELWINSPKAGQSKSVRNNTNRLAESIEGDPSVLLLQLQNWKTVTRISRFIQRLNVQMHKFVSIR